MNVLNHKISFDIDQSMMKNFKFQPFIAGMIAVFIIKIVMMTGVIQFDFASSMTRPVPEKVEPFDYVLPKLQQKPSSFQLYEKSSLIKAAHASGEYENANGYIVFDLNDGEILAQKNGSKSMSIASITKVMTAVVALDLASQDEYFTVSEHASEIIPTKIGVVPGERMRLEELLHAVLLTSANDAAEVVREGIDVKYASGVFIKAMNAKAEYIGMKDTRFANPQGFDDMNNYSTPQDLAILTHYALTNYPLIREIVKKDYHFLPEDENHKQFDLYNWNGLIGTYPNTYGVKIGNTGRAGVTTMVVSERENTQVGVILLGAPGVKERDMWAAQLFDLGFQEASGLEKVELTESQLQEKYDSWQFWN